MVWGRYLSTVPRIASGLTAGEITFLQRQNIKILPIYNDFRNAVGYENGKNVALRAITQAVRLRIPKETFIFANIEHYFQINEAWIRGWADTIRRSDYQSGMYHDPIRGPFSKAFCQAVKKDAKIGNETVLWSAQPEVKTTGPKNAPTFSPNSPKCQKNIWAWQYGRDAKTCPIDSNLIDRRLYNQLF